MSHADEDTTLELAITGELTEASSSLYERLLDIEPGAQCVLYFDSVGGSPYCGIGLTTLIRLRGLQATGVVIGECCSAALWPFAACVHRYVTPYSALLFHPIKWQSEENVGLSEAAEWARHFGRLETDMDTLLADLFGVSHEQLRKWSYPGTYMSGTELAENGLAELIGLDALPWLQAPPPSSARGKTDAKTKSRRKKRP